MSSTIPDGQSLFDDYIAKQDLRFTTCLINLRKLILNIIPSAQESFSYQAHCFKHIYMLVGIGVNKNFCSLYTMSPPLIMQLKDELAGCKVSGATIHFNPDEPLPIDLITQIVLARVKENKLLAAKRGKKK